MHTQRMHTSHTCAHIYMHVHTHTACKPWAPTCSARLAPGVGLQEFLGSLSSAPRPPALQEAGVDAATASGARGPRPPARHILTLCLAASLWVLVTRTPLGTNKTTIFSCYSSLLGFPGASDGKACACNAGDPGSIPGGKDPLEKEVATHSSTLAWKIPWTEEPGGL